MFLFGNPIALCIVMLSVIMFPPLLLFFIGILNLILYKFWIFVSEGIIPVKASKIFLPIFLMYCFQICAAIIDVSEPRFVITYFLYLIPVGLFFFMRDDIAFLIMPFVINAMTVLSVLVLVVVFKRTNRTIVYDKLIIIYIFMFASLASLSSHVSYVALNDRSTGAIESFFSPLQAYLLSLHGYTFISILETDYELELWSPIANYPWRRDKIQPGFNLFRIAYLGEEFLPPGSGEYRTELFISESILSDLKDPTNAVRYQNHAYSLYIFEREDILTNVSSTRRSYSNRASDSLSNGIRSTIINKINGLCYLDETVQLPHEFNSYELFEVGIFSRYFRHLESRGISIKNIIEISHNNFEYAYIFNFDVSEIDNVEFYCFIGFNKLEAKIPYYPWGNFDSFDDIYLSRQYYNYQYFLIFPSYDFFGSDVSNLTLLYNMDKQAIEEMINYIVNDIIG